MPQYAGTEVGLASERIDQRAVIVARHGIDRQVAAGEIFNQRHVRRREEFEAMVSPAVLAFGTGQRIFLARIPMQEDGKVATHRRVARGDQDLRCRANHDPVAVDHRATKELVAHGAADTIDFHGLRSVGTARHDRRSSGHESAHNDCQYG